MSSHGRCGCLWDSPHLACAWCGNCCHLRKIYAILVVKPALWESMRYVCGGRIIQQFLCGGKWHPFAWCQMRKEISQELLMLSVWLMIVRWQRLSRTQASSSEKCNQCLNGHRSVGLCSNCQIVKPDNTCQIVKNSTFSEFTGGGKGGGWSFQSWSNEKLGRSKFPMSRWRWWKLLESECNLHHLLWKVRQGDGHLHRWVQE